MARLLVAECGRPSVDHARLRCELLRSQHAWHQALPFAGRDRATSMPGLFAGLHLIDVTAVSFDHVPLSVYSGVSAYELSTL